VNAGWVLYGNEIALNYDDQALFERLVFTQTPNRVEIMRLVKEWGFLPTRKSTALDELLYKVCVMKFDRKMCEVDMAVFDALLVNGLVRQDHNDAIWNHVFKSTIPASYPRYLLLF
jgi:hypothetical protein